MEVNLESALKITEFAVAVSMVTPVDELSGETVKVLTPEPRLVVIAELVAVPPCVVEMVVDGVASGFTLERFAV